MVWYYKRTIYYISSFWVGKLKLRSDRQTPLKTKCWRNLLKHFIKHKQYIYIKKEEMVDNKTSLFSRVKTLESEFVWWRVFPSWLDGWSGPLRLCFQRADRWGRRWCRWKTVCLWDWRPNSAPSAWTREMDTPEEETASACLPAELQPHKHTQSGTKHNHICYPSHFLTRDYPTPSRTLSSDRSAYGSSPKLKTSHMSTANDHTSVLVEKSSSKTASDGSQRRGIQDWR